MDNAYTTSQLSKILEITPRAIIKRSQRENWRSRPRRGRGGGNEWLTASLPDAVRAAIAAREAREVEGRAVPAVPGGAVPLENMSEDRRALVLAKADLVNLYLEHLGRSKKRGKGRETFIMAYRAGMWPVLLERLGEVSWKTIERWKVQVNRYGVGALADQRGQHTRGTTTVSEAFGRFLIQAALYPTGMNLSEAIRRAKEAAQAVGMAGLPNDRTCRRFLRVYMEHHYGTWIFCREGRKAWNDKCAFFISRDYDKIDVGDVVVADGHVLNFQTLNPWTGKETRMELVVWYDMKSNYPLGWEVMSTENILSISTAFRRACLALGKYPRVAYLDNGKAFRAKFFHGVDFSQSGLVGLFQEIGVASIFAWPYHGQSKTVERFFGTFGELERWVPSCVGRSIDTKPPRMHRGEKVHKAIYERAGGRPLTLEETHRALAHWFDVYARRPQRGHLKGRTPLEVFREGRGDGTGLGDMRQMMLAKALRTVNRQGVSLHGETYYHPDLYSRKHEVLVRYDLQDRESVYVYYPDGRYICEASRVRGVHPAARVLGTDEDRDDLRKVIALRKEQEKEAGDSAQAMLQAVVIPEHRRRMATLEGQAPTDQAPEPERLSQARIESIEAAKTKARKAIAARPAYIPPAQVPTIVTERDKYEYLFKLSRRDQVPLRREDAAWMANFERSPDFGLVARRYEQLGRTYERRRLKATRPRTSKEAP